MSNRLPNAGLLDLTTGWTASGPLALTVDETNHGAPGRTVLRAAGNATADGQTLTVQPATGDRPEVDVGDLVEGRAYVAAFVAGVAVAPSVRLIFRTAGAVQVSALDMPVQNASLTAHGEAVGGVPATFRRVYLRAVAPATTANATIEVRVTANNGQAVEILILKPLVGVASSAMTEPLTWDPGVHEAEDLQLGVWPAILKPFQAASGGEPKPARVEFETDRGRPSSRRTDIDPVRRFEGTMRCDAVQREALEAFARTAGDFWFVEPDSDRLCVASFAADGAPRMIESRGPTVMMAVGLWLETA